MSGGKDCIVKISSFSRKKTLSSLIGHTDSVYCVQLRGNRIYSSGHDSTIRIWSLDQKNSLLTITGHEGLEKIRICGDSFTYFLGPITHIEVDSEKIVSCSDDCSVSAWDIETGKNLVKFVGHTGKIFVFHFYLN